MLFKLLDDCKIHSDFYFTFIYVLSVLESYLNRNLGHLTYEESDRCKTNLVQFLIDGQITGFSRIKLCKIISLLLCSQIPKNKTAFHQLISLFPNTAMLEFLRVFLEELATNDHLVQYQTDVKAVLLTAGGLIITPLGASLMKLQKITPENEG